MLKLGEILRARGMSEEEVCNFQVKWTQLVRKYRQHGLSATDAADLAAWKLGVQLHA